MYLTLTTLSGKSLAVAPHSVEYFKETDHPHPKSTEIGLSCGANFRVTETMAQVTKALQDYYDLDIEQWQKEHPEQFTGVAQLEPNLMEEEERCSSN